METFRPIEEIFENIDIMVKDLNVEVSNRDILVDSFSDPKYFDTIIKGWNQTKKTFCRSSGVTYMNLSREYDVLLMNTNITSKKVPRFISQYDLEKLKLECKNLEETVKSWVTEHRELLTLISESIKKEKIYENISNLCETETYGKNMRDLGISCKLSEFRKDEILKLVGTEVDNWDRNIKYVKDFVITPAHKKLLKEEYDSDGFRLENSLSKYKKETLNGFRILYGKLRSQFENMQNNRSSITEESFSYVEQMTLNQKNSSILIYKNSSKNNTDFKELFPSFRPFFDDSYTPDTT